MIHRNMRLWCAVLVVAVLALTSCEVSDPANGVAPTFDENRPLRIVATIRPLELIVRELLDAPGMENHFEVAAIMTPDVSPHGFEPTPAQMMLLQRADIVVLNGLGLDDWAARDLPRTTRVLRFDDVVDLDDEHHHHHHHDDDDHVHGPDCDHGPIDEHFWVDPELVGKFATSIALHIGRLLDPDPDDPLQPMEPMREPLTRFLRIVDDVDQELASRFSAHTGKRIVTHHNVFSRLTDRYGLGEPIVLRPLAVLEPTPGDLRRAIEAIREENIRSIFIEPQFSAAAAQRVRDETNVELILVDPLGSTASSWSDLMHTIADALVRGLE